MGLQAATKLSIIYLVVFMTSVQIIYPNTIFQPVILPGNWKIELPRKNSNPNLFRRLRVYVGHCETITTELTKLQEKITILSNIQTKFTLVKLEKPITSELIEASCRPTKCLNLQLTIYIWKGVCYLQDNEIFKVPNITVQLTHCTSLTNYPTQWELIYWGKNPPKTTFWKWNVTVLLMFPFVMRET